jgi:magnesium-protoporphyrin O-methyltransferase
MLSPSHGSFEHVVAMDSLIHYSAEDAVRAVGRLAARTSGSILFTFAPRTPALAAMHAVGRMFPRSDRAPSIVPIAEPVLRNLLAADRALANWVPSRTSRIGSGFYQSQAVELVRG